MPILGSQINMCKILEDIIRMITISNHIIQIRIIITEFS